MVLFKKAQSGGPCEYVMIAKTPAQSLMDAASTRRIKQKFETVNVIAKEKLAFSKMKLICELEECHDAIWCQNIRMIKSVPPLSCL